MADVGYIRFDASSVREVIWQELTELQARIIDNMRSANLVASGRTIQSMHVTTNEEGGILWGRKFFGALETGSAPHKNAYNPPVNFFAIIRAWMDAKGIHGINERDTNSIAWAITQTIRKKGTLQYRKGARSDIYSEEIPVTIQRVNERLWRMIETEMKSIKLNNQKFGGNQ